MSASLAPKKSGRSPSVPIYMDNHATTRVDPRVLAVMLPYFGEHYGNAGSVNHAFGWAAKEAVDAARASIAANLHALPREIVFTSGATESNNLAIRGVAERYRDKGRHIITVATEHPSVFEPLKKLGRRGYDVTVLPVAAIPGPEAGRVLPEQVAEAIRPDTILVSVMLANHEIGVIQPVAEIARVCGQHGVLVHADATQAVGKIPVDVERLDIDLMSFSAHKIFGPKGVGALWVRRREPSVRIEPLIDGGGQEAGLRSGTLNVPGVVGFARALELCCDEMSSETKRLKTLRGRLFAGLCETLDGVTLNGPSLASELRLPGNLNVAIAGVEGESLLVSMKELAVSSGSACASERPEPSHVLRAIGLSDEAARSSLRFGLGRFNTAEEVEIAVQTVSQTVSRLRQLSRPS
jgi:cysteine desulfurase